MQRKKNFPKELSENLKKVRIMNGLTQEQVTKKLQDRNVNVTRQSYNRYENNNAEPEYETLKNLALIFGTDVNRLVGFEPDGQVSIPSDDRDEMEQTIFELLFLDDDETCCRITRNEKRTRYTCEMDTIAYEGRGGNIQISPKGELILTEEQITAIHKAAKYAWNKGFLVFFQRVLRVVKDNKPEDPVIFVDDLLTDDIKEQIRREAKNIGEHRKL